MCDVASEFFFKRDGNNNSGRVESNESSYKITEPHVARTITYAVFYGNEVEQVHMICREKMTRFEMLR